MKLEIGAGEYPDRDFDIHVDVLPQAITCGTGGYVSQCQGRVPTSSDGVFKCAGYGP